LSAEQMLITQEGSCCMELIS